MVKKKNYLQFIIKLSSKKKIKKIENVKNLDDVILFDGVCNLCNNWVNFIINYDKKKKFKFCFLQSTLGKKFLRDIGKDAEHYDSIYLIKDGKIYSKYYASTYVMANSIKPFYILFLMNFIIPKPILNFFYDLVGKNRYKIFGKKKNCLVPNKKIRDRFINVSF